MRSFRTGFSADQLAAYQRGTLSYQYRGVPCLKSPIDIGIYINLFHQVRPRTIFEIGSKSGGSAMLFRDIGRMLELEMAVTSIDLNPPAPDASRDIEFLRGDAGNLGDVFAVHDLFARPRPWLVIEDSAHDYTTTSAVLSFCGIHLQKGEYLIIEDGVLEELGLAERYDGGPNRAIAAFFEHNQQVFRIDETYCDMFGPNLTYNPNGYLIRL